MRNRHIYRSLVLRAFKISSAHSMLVPGFAHGFNRSRAIACSSEISVTRCRSMGDTAARESNKIAPKQLNNNKVSKWSLGTGVIIFCNLRMQCAVRVRCVF